MCVGCVAVLWLLCRLGCVRMCESSDGCAVLVGSQPSPPLSLFASAAHCRSARHFLSSVSPRCSLSVAPPLFYPSLLLADPSRPSDVATHFLRSLSLQPPFGTDPAYHLRQLRHFYASRVEQLQRSLANQGGDEAVQLQQRRSEQTAVSESEDGTGSTGSAAPRLPQADTESSGVRLTASSPSPASLYLPQPPLSDSLSGLFLSSAVADLQRRSGSAVASHPSFVLPRHFHPSLLSSSVGAVDAPGSQSSAAAAAAAWLAARLPSASSTASSAGLMSLPLPLPPSSTALTVSSSSASSALATALSFRRARAFPAGTAGGGSAPVSNDQTTDESQPQQADKDDHTLHHAVAVADHSMQRSHGVLISGRSAASSNEQWEKEAVSDQRSTLTPLHSLHSAVASVATRFTVPRLYVRSVSWPAASQLLGCDSHLPR